MKLKTLTENSQGSLVAISGGAATGADPIVVYLTDARTAEDVQAFYNKYDVQHPFTVEFIKDPISMTLREAFCAMYGDGDDSWCLCNFEDMEGVPCLERDKTEVIRHILGWVKGGDTLFASQAVHNLIKAGIKWPELAKIQKSVGP